MEELPCFLTYERVGIFGDCTPTSDPLLSAIQILVLSFVGLGLGGVIYYGLKSWKEKRELQSNRSVKG